MSPLPPSFPEFSLLSMTPFDMHYPFGQFGSDVLAISPHHLLATPSPLTLWGGGWRESLDAMQTLFNSTQTWCVNSVLVTVVEHSTIWAARKKVKFVTSSQPDLVQGKKKKTDFSHPNGYKSPIYLSFELLLKKASFCLAVWSMKSAVRVMIALEDFKIVGVSFCLIF